MSVSGVVEGGARVNSIIKNKICIKFLVCHNIKHIWSFTNADPF